MSTSKPPRFPLAWPGIPSGKTGAVAAVGVLVLAVVAVSASLAVGGGGPTHSHQTTAVGGSTGGSSPTTHVAAPSRLILPTATPVGASTGGASYPVAATSFKVTVTATGPCWVEAKASASSTQTLYVGTLQTGASQTFNATGSMWIRLGWVGHAQVSLDGTPVQIPASGASPFDLSFAPAPA